MNSIFTKIIFLSLLVVTAACGEKPETEPPKKEEVSEEKGEKKSPQVRFKAVPLPDKSTYKSPSF